jgi:hypothetical protein
VVNQVDDAGPPTGARVGTLVVIATMAGIAVVAVTAVVWARIGDPGAAEQASSADAAPSTLADGSEPTSVPAAVAAAVETPVIGAARLDQLPDHMLDGCLQHQDVSWEVGGPRLEYAVVTSDVVVASLIGAQAPGGFDPDAGPEQPDEVRLRCHLQLENGMAVNSSTGRVEPVLPGGPRGDFVHSSCCDSDGMATASSVVQVPADAHWALQDRGTWHLAYPVDGTEHVPVTWRYRERRMGPGESPVSAVTFVADDGTVVGEATAGGDL